MRLSRRCCDCQQGAKMTLPRSLAVPVLCFTFAAIAFVLWLVWYEIPIGIFGISTTRVRLGIVLGLLVYAIYSLVDRLVNRFIVDRLVDRFRKKGMQ